MARGYVGGMGTSNKSGTAPGPARRRATTATEMAAFNAERNMGAVRRINAREQDRQQALTPPTPDETETLDTQIANRVKVLLVRTGGHRRELAEDLRLSQASLSRSLTDNDDQRRSWSAQDVQRLGTHFNVDPGLFYTDEAEFWAQMSRFERR